MEKKPDYNTNPDLSEALYKIVERRALQCDDDRISVRKLLEDVRQSGDYGEPINNNVLPQVARRLIAEHPQLGERIATRALGRRGRNLVDPDSDLGLVLQALAARPSIRIAQIVLVTPSGTTTTVDVAQKAARLRALDVRPLCLLGGELRVEGGRPFDARPA